MLGVLKRKTIVRVTVFALLLTMTAWMVPANRQEAGAAETALQNPRTAADGAVIWDCVLFGTYPQSADGSGGFKIEPIKWRVLSVDGNDAFLLADKGLDAGRYNEDWDDVTWETSTVRSWLNGSSSDNFLGKAFTAAEQGAIYEKTIQNPDNPYSGTEGGNATKDKIFFLSIDEVTNPAYGFPGDYSDVSDVSGTRRTANMDYAKSRGAWEYAGNGWWWLRSPGADANCAADVDIDGSVNCYGNTAFSDNAAIRPALHLNLSASDLWSYAGTVSSSSIILTDTKSKAVYTITWIDIGGTDRWVTYTKPTEKNVSTAVIPNTVTLKGVTYKVTAIAPNAFKNCKKLKKVTIGDNIYTIGANAFNKCTKLKSVTIPKNVRKIQKGAFANCRNLKTITIKMERLTKKSIGENAFKGISAKAVIKVPKGKVKEYKKILQSKGLSKKAIVKSVK